MTCLHEVARVFSSTPHKAKCSVFAPVIFAGPESVATDVFRDSGAESALRREGRCPHFSGHRHA